MARPKRSEVVAKVDELIERMGAEISYFKNEKRFADDEDKNMLELQRQDYATFQSDLVALKRYIETDA